MEEVKERFNRLATRWKLLIVGAGVLLAAPFAFAAFMGVITIVSLIIAMAIVSATIAFAPVWAMKLANARMKAVKAEASRNPIETRWNIYHERIRTLEVFGGQIERFTAKLGQFESQLAQLRKDYPTECGPFERTYSAMVQLKRAREQEYLRAREKMQAYKRETEKAERIWTMAQSARALGEAAGMQIDPLKEIAEKTALESVELEMNASFAQLDRLMLERIEEPAALPAPGQTMSERMPVQPPVEVRR